MQVEASQHARTQHSPTGKQLHQYRPFGARKVTRSYSPLRVDVSQFSYEIRQKKEKTKVVVKCRTANSAVYISPFFYYAVSFCNYIHINNPASFIQSHFPTGQC